MFVAEKVIEYCSPLSDAAYDDNKNNSLDFKISNFI